MTYDFSGKVVLITGAASGIGYTAAIEFAKEGAAVAAVDIVEPKETVFAIEAGGGSVLAFVCDVSKPRQVEEMVAKIVKRFGRLDFAFNCAGIGPDGVRIPYAELTETEDADWQKIVDVNLTGTYNLLKHEVLQMQKQGGGVIVNTGSTAGYRFPPGFHGYAATKAGVIALTELASNENAHKGIRVNAVCPGPTYGTQMMNNSISADNSMEEFTKNLIPTGRFNVMEDVVEAVKWLCSDLARQTTGQALFVDGGMHTKP